MVLSKKKFLIKCFCVLMPLWIVWGYIWFFPDYYVAGGSNHPLINQGVMDDINQSFDVVVLGDSVANASFAPEYMSEGTINLGVNATTPVEAYYILLDYLQAHNVPKTCFLVFAPKHMARENGLYESYFFTHRFSVSRELEILKQAHVYREDSILKGNIYNMYKEWLSYRLRLPNKYIHELINSLPNRRRNLHCTHVKTAIMHRGNICSRYTTESNDYEWKSYEDFIVRPLFDVYYRKILDLCNAHGIKVHIVMTPICPNVYCTEKYQQSLHDYYNKLQNDYPNITFLDRIGGFERKHMQDTHHVNLHGALKFSKIIKRLYPEEFKESENGFISSKTIDGMVDYLQMENYPSEILRRVEDTNFSVLIIRWPNMGGEDLDLIEAVNECYPLMRQQAGVLTSRTKDAAAFFVNGMEKSTYIERGIDGSRLWNTAGEEWILRMDESTVVRDINLVSGPSGQEQVLRMNESKASLVLPWEEVPFEIDPELAIDMTVVIINGYDKKIVSTKDFIFSQGSYKLFRSR